MTLQFHSGVYPEKTWSKRIYTQYTSVFTEALFTVAKTWKQPKCPSTQNKEDTVYTHTHTPHSHTMEYYSVIKTNEIMSTATTRMHLETVILSELSQTVKYHLTSLTCRI